MRKYELIFIIRPDATEEELDKLIAQMEGVVAGAGGKLERVDKMGRRRLAYRVGRYREGFYVLFILEGSGETVKEFERRLRVTDSVIKFLTVRVDEEQKRLDKIKAIRDARRKAPPAPATPEASGEAPAPATV